MRVLLLTAATLLWSSQDIERLIRELSDDDPRKRDQAEQELIQAGAGARPALRQKLDGNADAEFRQRAARILKTYRLQDALGKIPGTEFAASSDKLKMLLKHAQTLYGVCLTGDAAELVGSELVAGLKTRSEKLALLEQVGFHRLRAGLCAAAPLLKDPDPAVRSSALSLLNAMGPPERFPLEMLEDADAQPRLQASLLIGRWGGASETKEVAQLLDHASGSVRQYALQTLGRLKASECKDRISAFLSDPGLCADAARALGAIGAVEHAKAISKLLEDKSGTVRSAALHALYDLKASEFHAEIARCLQGDDLFHRADAARALGRFGDLRYAGPISALLDQSDDYVRSVALTALGRLKAGEYAERIASLLGDNSPSIRIAVLNALAELGAQDRFSEMAKLARDPDPRVRHEAISHLRRLDAIDLLLECLSDGNPETRRLAALEFGFHPSAQAVPALSKRLDDADVAVRRAAVFGWTRCQPGADLKRFASDSDEEIRAIAAYAGAENDLAKLLRDSSPKVRWAAAFALKGEGEPSVDPDIRQASLMASGKFVELGDPWYIAELIRDPEPSARWRAAKALASIKTESARRSLKCALDREPFESVRSISSRD